MVASPLPHIFPRMPIEMPQKKLGDGFTPSLYTSASCMDFHPRREDDGSRQRPSNQHLQPTSHQQPSRTGQLPHSSPLPQTQWTDVPPVYRPRDWVDPNEVSPVSTRQPQRPDPMTAWRARPAPPPSSDPAPRQDASRPRTRRAPRIFRRQDTAESPQHHPPVDVSMLYPQLSPYDPNRMSTYSAPEQLEHAFPRSVSQPNSPGFAPSWSALPSRNDEPPSPVGIPRSPTYPPAGRRRMRSAAGLGDAAFDDEQDFRLFVEATAGLLPELGFSATQPSQSPLRRAATTQFAGPSGRRQSETGSPAAETPTTMFALQQLAAIPQANQTYRPQRAPQTQPHRQQQPQHPTSTAPTRPQATRTASQRDRLAASASGLDLWLPSPISPQSQPPQPQSATQSISRRPVGYSPQASSYADVSPLTPAAPAQQATGFHGLGLDREVERQLEELELEGDEDEYGRRDYDDELPDYAQSQAEAQAGRRAEAARRAQELQERWLRRGR